MEGLAVARLEPSIRAGDPPGEPPLYSIVCGVQPPHDAILRETSAGMQEVFSKNFEHATAPSRAARSLSRGRAPLLTRCAPCSCAALSPHMRACRAAFSRVRVCPRASSRIGMHGAALCSARSAARGVARRNCHPAMKRRAAARSPDVTRVDRAARCAASRRGRCERIPPTRAARPVCGPRRSIVIRVKPMLGVEPRTPALRKPCSTIELHRHRRWNRRTHVSLGGRSGGIKRARPWPPTRVVCENSRNAGEVNADLRRKHPRPDANFEHLQDSTGWNEDCSI